MSATRTSLGRRSGRASIALVLVLASAMLPEAPDCAATEPPPALSAECLGCHTDKKHGGHPIGTTVPAPVSLPLGARRTVECTSCHDTGIDHHSRARPVRLRMTVPGLCAECHGTPAPEGSARFHAVAMKRAHGSTNSRPPGTATDLDDASRHCLTCHDGSAARSVISDSTWAATGHQDGHASGTSYRAMQKRVGLQLRPESAIPGPIRLLDGRIGCGTCHSAYSRLPKLLQLPLAGSALCKACHDL